MVANFTHCVKILEENKLNFTHLQNGMGSIFENILINVVLCIIILILFLALLGHAWRNQHDKSEIYKDSWICLLYRDAFDLISPHDLQRMHCTYQPLDRNMTFLQMLWFCFFSLKEDEISERCGVDAVQYLNFLEWTLLYNAINTAIAFCFILPTNLNGKVHANQDNFFVKTMMDNLDVSQEWAFCIHIFVHAILITVGVYIIRKFSAGLYSCKRRKWAKRSVVVKDLSNEPLTSDRITEHFSKVLPRSRIEDIKLVYKYKHLIKLNKQLENMEEALALCHHIRAVEGREVYVKEIGWCCHFWCNLPCDRYKVDGIEHYNRKLKELRNEVAMELSILPEKIFRFAYVTFDSEYTANLALKLEEDAYWKIKKAKEPTNIDWCSLTRRGSNFTLKTTIINMVIFLIAVFLTTPTIIMAGIEKNVSEQTKKMAEMHRKEKQLCLVSKSPFWLQMLLFWLKAVFYRFMSVFLSWLVAATMSLVVIYSSRWMDFETKSGTNISIMMKTVVYLIFAVVILPPLGLASIGAFLVKAFAPLVWSCLFLPGNGYFFVSYVITSALVGNLIQLLHLADILWNFCGVIFSKSEVEKTIIRRCNLWDFIYGVQYAYSLLIFFIISFYTLMIPIIAPAGLLYFATKLAVDRYNICFNCTPSQVNSKVHFWAIHVMMFALVLKPCGLIFFLYTRTGWTIVTYAAITIAAVSFLVWFITMNPLKFDFIPKILLMPHRLFPPNPPHYYEEVTAGEREVYQPYALKKYISVLPAVDRYENFLYNA